VGGVNVTKKSSERASENPTSLGHTPRGRWEFDDSVAAVFDDMLRRSIPQYDTMRRAVFDIGSQFVQEHTDIVDLGCSRGEALAPLISKYGRRNRYVGVDVSAPMLAACRQRFGTLIDSRDVSIEELDLRHGYPEVHASLTLSVLTIQFTPTEYRQQIMRNAWDHTIQGGALILVEKVRGATGHLDTLMVDLYHRMKREAGYSQEEIDRKRLALEGILVPVTARCNEDLLAHAGFTHVDCFWRWMNFAGWVAIKT